MLTRRDKPREASDEEKQAALYNTACCLGAMGNTQVLTSSMTCKENPCCVAAAQQRIGTLTADLSSCFVYTGWLEGGCGGAGGRLH
jgi:hypothetical protein